LVTSGAWYLLAERNDTILPYGVANIVEAEMLDQRFERASKFDLSAHWPKAVRAYEAGLNRLAASVRLSPQGRSMLHLFGLHVVEHAGQTATCPEEAGRVRCELLLESTEFGVRDLLRLGTDVEMLAPSELYDALKRAASGVVDIYRGVYDTSTRTEAADLYLLISALGGESDNSVDSYGTTTLRARSVG